MAIANAGNSVSLLAESTFVASLRKSGARMREPREANMNRNAVTTRKRWISHTQ